MKTKTMAFHDIILESKCKCPNCNKEITAKVSAHDIHAGESECEMCGSHGDITLDVHCPECKKIIEVTVRSW